MLLMLMRSLQVTRSRAASGSSYREIASIHGVPQLGADNATGGLAAASTPRAPADAPVAFWYSSAPQLHLHVPQAARNYQVFDYTVAVAASAMDQPRGSPDTPAETRFFTSRTYSPQALASAESAVRGEWHDRSRRSDGLCFVGMRLSRLELVLCYPLLMELLDYTLMGLLGPIGDKIPSIDLPRELRAFNDKDVLLEEAHIIIPVNAYPYYRCDARADSPSPDDEAGNMHCCPYIMGEYLDLSVDTIHVTNATGSMQHALQYAAQLPADAPSAAPVSAATAGAGTDQSDSDAVDSSLSSVYVERPHVKPVTLSHAWESVHPVLQYFLRLKNVRLASVHPVADLIPACTSSIPAALSSRFGVDLTTPRAPADTLPQRLTRSPLSMAEMRQRKREAEALSIRAPLCAGVDLSLHLVRPVKDVVEGSILRAYTDEHVHVLPPRPAPWSVVHHDPVRSTASMQLHDRDGSDPQVPFVYSPRSFSHPYPETFIFASISSPRLTLSLPQLILLMNVISQNINADSSPPTRYRSAAPAAALPDSTASALVSVARSPDGSGRPNRPTAVWYEYDDPDAPASVMRWHFRIRDARVEFVESLAPLVSAAAQSALKAPVAGSSTGSRTLLAHISHNVRSDAAMMMTWYRLLETCPRLLTLEARMLDYVRGDDVEVCEICEAPQALRLDDATSSAVGTCCLQAARYVTPPTFFGGTSRKCPTVTCRVLLYGASLTDSRAAETGANQAQARDSNACTAPRNLLFPQHPRGDSSDIKSPDAAAHHPVLELRWTDRLLDAKRAMLMFINEASGCIAPDYVAQLSEYFLTASELSISSYGTGPPSDIACASDEAKAATVTNAAPSSTGANARRHSVTVLPFASGDTANSALTRNPARQLPPISLICAC